MQPVEPRLPSLAVRPLPDPGSTLVGLIGPGNVGSRVLDLMARHASPERTLLGIANSRSMRLARTCLADPHWRESLDNSTEPSSVARLANFLAGLPAGRRILVDVTASRSVAERHADWLASGFEVVTANKWAAAGEQSQWPRLARRGYRYATTVGAGLPVLDTLRSLNAAGDRLVAIEGVLSGTLSFLMRRLSDGRDFAECVSEAHALGLTEPDPRLDLSGLDVARKLVIAVRAAGLSLDIEEVAIDSLVSPETRACTPEAFLGQSAAMRRHWDRLRGECPGRGEAIVHLGRASVEADGRVRARVGLERVSADSPFAGLDAGDNMVSIRTRTYSEQPIWIRGPGAGSDVTALQVWSEIVAASGG